MLASNLGVDKIRGAEEEVRVEAEATVEERVEVKVFVEDEVLDPMR